MRDAFGGAFMIKIFIIFIFIYVCFIAVAMNYAKAFKVKNKIIDYLEDNEISSLQNMSASDFTQMQEFFDTEIVGKMNYTVNEFNICSNVETKDDTGRTVAYCDDIGIVIRESGKSENTKGVYYTVSTYVGWSIPFLNNLLSLGGSKGEDTVAGVWKISGQTRLIVNDGNN